MNKTGAEYPPTLEMVGTVLVDGGHTLDSDKEEENDDPNQEVMELLYSDTGLSFWGGVDPITGIIVDHTHSLHGECIASSPYCDTRREEYKKNIALAIPSGRGSCTGSQVMLELTLNGKAPSVIILAEADPILAVGAIIAQEFFSHRLSEGTSREGAVDRENKASVARAAVPTIINIGSKNFKKLGQIINEFKNDTPKVAIHYASSLEKASSLQQIMVTVGHTNELKRMCKDHSTKPLANNGTFHSTMKKTSDSNNALEKSYPGLTLTQEEQSILDGTHPTLDSVAHRRAFHTLCHISQICGATHLLPIEQAHIDGCTYIGPGGLQFAQQLVKDGGKVVVPTTLNSISVDRAQWRVLGVDAKSLGLPASQLANAYLQLGCRVDSFTCAPYLLYSTQENDANDNKPNNLEQDTMEGSNKSLSSSHPRRPSTGDHIAWGESNAVVFANSIWGARTLKYADYMDICAALVGRVPAYGAHLDAGRRPGIVLDVKELLIHVLKASMQKSFGELDVFFPLLGYVCGSLSQGFIPLITGMEDYSDSLFPTLEDEQYKNGMKAFCAAFGTTGSAPLFHIAGITPEAKDIDMAWTNSWKIDPKERQRMEENAVIVTWDHMENAFQNLDSATKNCINNNSTVYKSSTIPVGLVALGNPHLSLSECQILSSLVNKNMGKLRKHPDVKFIACLSRTVYDQAETRGYIQPIREFGMQFINDTCWCMLTEPVVPITEKSYLLPSTEDNKNNNNDNSSIRSNVIMTNSGKYAHYAPGLVRKRVKFGSLEACLEAAHTGFAPLDTRPTWLYQHYSIASSSSTPITTNIRRSFHTCRKFEFSSLKFSKLISKPSVVRMLCKIL